MASIAISDAHPIHPPRGRVDGWRALATTDARAEWDALATRASERNPFYESWYLLPALEAFDSEGTVEIFTLRIDGVLAGLVPLVRKPRYDGKPLPHLANWMHANCFLGVPLVREGAETAFWQALLSHADRSAGTSLFLHLHTLSDEGPHWAALESLSAQTGRCIETVASHRRAVLNGGVSPEEHLAAHVAKKRRKEFGRKRRRLEETGKLVFTRHHDSADLDRWIDEFLTLECAGWKGANRSALACADETAALFRAALTGAAERGQLERIAFHLDGRAIAMLCNFITPPEVFSFKTAFDETLSSLSPGVLLQVENLALLEREGLARCDSCAASDHPMIDHIWRDRRSIVRASVAIGGSARRAMGSALIRFEAGRAKDRT